MLKKWNRILAFMLSIALVITTFGSDFASAKAYAEEGTDETITVEEQAPAETQTETETWSEITEPTTEETTPPAVEDEPKVVPEVIPEVVPEGEKNPEEVPEVVEPTEEEPAEDEDEVSDEDAEEAEEDEEASEEATEEKNVTVTYTADKGGYVSDKSETINVNDKDAAFKGSTATAWNDKYEFTEWVDADGIQVCTEPTFTPAGLTEDATFTAKFVAVDNIEELMPKVSGSLSSSTLEVTVSAEAGIFPAGTTVTITEIGDDQALATAKEAIPAATSAKGVDITFHDVDGKEIQPANSKYVNVSMTLKAALEGDNFAVVHDHGDVETIGASISQDAEGNATEATFTSNEFSVFIVAGTDNDDEILRKVEHYTFEVKNSSDVWETVSEQDITSGDELACPEIPSLTKNQVFQGWYFWDTDANDFGEPVEFGVKSDVTNEAKYTVRAKVQTTYYVTFIGAEGEVVAVEAVTADSSEDEAPLTLTVSVQPKEDTQNFTGWTNLNNKYYKDGATIDASDDNNRTLTAFIEKGYWVHFDENDGGDGGGASYTRPEFVVEGGKATRPANPTRNGYVFRGWYADKNCTEEFDFNTTIIKTTYIYAKWAKGTAPFTVIIWKQNVDTDKNAAFDPKNYDYDSQTVIEGHATDDLIKDSWLGNALNKNFTGFNATPKKVITNDGKISAKGDTVVNVYYDRKKITYRFYTADYYTSYGSNRYVWNAKEYTSLKEMSGLYGQPISKYDGYRWPSEREWFEYEGSTYYYGEEIEILGQGMTFLAQFSTDGDKDFYSYEAAGGSLKVRHYKQNKDGSSYPTEATDSTNIRNSGNNTWYFSNKYDGFTVKSYRVGNSGSYQNVPGGNNPSVPFSENLYIRYERNKYKLTLMSVAASIDPETQKVIAENTAQTVQEYKDILFESSLTSYKDKAINDAKKIKTPPIPGYVPKLAEDGTIGIWKDEAGTELFDFDTTMPATNDTRAYIVWVKPKYKVYFDLNVDGDKDMDTTTGYNTVETNGQPTTLDLYYGDKVVRDTVMTKFVRSGYDLVGWFVKETDKTYDYGAVTSDVNLYAKWRKQGGTKIKYEENGTYIKNKDTGARENVAGTMLDSNRDTHTYATDSTVVVTAGSTAVETDKFTFIGWELLDKNRNVVKAYYPNDHFDLDDSYIVTEVGEDGEKENYVVLRALYAKTGGGTAADTTTLTYNINDGSASPKTVTISKNGDHDLRVNEKIQAWTLAEAEKNNFKREGFELLGWNIDQNEANEGTFKIALGKEYIIANNKNSDDNPSTNVLYAVWKELNGSYTVEYYKSFPASSGAADVKIGEPVTVEGVKAGTKITAADIDVDKYRETAGVGYKAGVVDPASTTIEAGKNKTIKVVYKPVKATITVEGNYYSTTYNGQEQSVSFPKDATNDDPGFKVTSIKYDADDVSGIISKDDVSIRQSIGASGTEVDEYPFNLGPEDFVLNNDDILDYEFKIAKDSEGNNKDGIFEILPVGKVKVVITGKTDELPYNGKEQSVTGFEFTSNNDLFTAASFTYKGKTGDEAQAAAIAKGTDVNDEGYAMGLDKKDFAVVNTTTFPDVEFEVRADGLLTITPRTVNITVAGKKETKTFNGEEQSVTGFETYEVEVVEVEGADTPDFSTADVIFDFDGNGTADEEDDAIATGLTPDTYPMGLKKAMFTLDPKDMNFVLGTVDVTDGELVIENGNGEIEIAFSVTDVTKPYTGYMQTVEALATVEGPKEPLYKKVLDAISDALTITAGAADDQTTFEFKNKTYVVKNIKVKAEGRNVTEGSAGIPPYDFELEKDIVITLDDVDVTKSFTVNKEGLKGKFNITPVDLTYTADDKSKVQGTADPALTAQLTGLIGEDVARKADVEAFLKEITEIYRDKGEDVGTYVIHIDPKSFEPQEPIRPMVKALADDVVVVDDTEGIDFESMTLITNNYNEPKLVNGLFTITAAPGPNPPTPTPPTPTPTPDTPAPVAAPAVLGAQREVEVDGPAVLGARRGRTADDTATGTARIFAIIVSAAVAIALLFKGKKKEEDEV
ncbi:InlB B-repeat-containing protein [Butyrivibrio sp. FCS014]|uniref:InlB B-repeat-containing protein n=1 Tax=Butyrivibrio sp. FCS014 TaxID=1408304 RepID=UPI000463B78A|nr:InlB B-repeat-containing protein [Butyrivibrio sp. FCS014]